MADTIFIRKAETSDFKEVYNLIKELAVFEKAPDEPSISLEKFIQDGTAKPPKYHVIVAEKEQAIVGMALYYYGYSSWKGAMLYLDDIIVKEDCRKNGIGKLLMDELINIAKEERVNIMKWQVLDWNENAINFYKKYPVVMDGEWINVKIEKENLA